jgi:hypothetical protein
VRRREGCGELVAARKVAAIPVSRGGTVTWVSMTTAMTTVSETATTIDSCANGLDCSNGFIDGDRDRSLRLR